MACFGWVRKWHKSSLYVWTMEVSIHLTNFVTFVNCVEAFRESLQLFTPLSRMVWLRGWIELSRTKLSLCYTMRFWAKSLLTDVHVINLSLNTTIGPKVAYCCLLAGLATIQVSFRTLLQRGGKVRMLD